MGILWAHTGAIGCIGLIYFYTLTCKHNSHHYKHVSWESTYSSQSLTMAIDTVAVMCNRPINTPGTQLIIFH